MTRTARPQGPTAPDDGARPAPDAHRAADPGTGADRTVRLRGVRVEAAGPTSSAVLLEGVDLELSAPRVAVVGENGSGKSTLARAVAGLADVTAGEVIVHGVDAVRDVKGLRRTVGMVFANPAAQMVMPTVREDVELTVKALRGPDGRRLSTEEVARRTDAALAGHRLTALADRACLSLSSGQAQRLAVCSVMTAAPSLVIADEPTSLLDGRHRQIIADRLLAADPSAPGGFQLLLVTHDLELARACDEAVWVHAGRIERTGPAADVVAAYEAFLDRAVAEELA